MSPSYTRTQGLRTKLQIKENLQSWTSHPAAVKGEGQIKQGALSQARGPLGQRASRSQGGFESERAMAQDLASGGRRRLLTLEGLEVRSLLFL